MSESAQPRRRQSSITTRRGDAGQTGLGGGDRISKADARVEAYGAIDELNTTIGLARTLCDDVEITAELRLVQRELFAVGSAISTKPESRKPIPEIGGEMVARLDALVERLESEPGVLRDWSIPGEYRGSAALDMARAIARRAERAAVRYVTGGGIVQPNVLAYLNRVSDVLWIAARVVEARAGINAALRDSAHPGPPWSRAW
jgi:cob(I)alamin adenosyltransferase